MSTSDIHSNGVTAQPHPTTSTPTTSKDPDAIRADIERTREELAETVDALARQARREDPGQGPVRARQGPGDHGRR